MSSVHLTLRKWKLQPKLNDASHAAGSQRQQLAGLGSFLTVTPCCPSSCQSKNKKSETCQDEKEQTVTGSRSDAVKRGWQGIE